MGARHAYDAFNTAAPDARATAIEYGLIAALIAVAAIGAMKGLGNNLKATFNNVATNLKQS